MAELSFLLEALEKLQTTPILLLMAAIFILGYMLKNYTSFNNKLIPWVLLLAAIVFNMVLNGMTLANAIIGMIVAYLTMAFYEHIKTTLEAIVQSRGVK